MHRPRDDFERELDGGRSIDTWRITPVWTLLGLAAAVYLLAAVVAVRFRGAGISTANPAAIVLFEGLLVVLRSGLLAGWGLIVVWRLLERASRRWYRH